MLSTLECTITCSSKGEPITAKAEPDDRREAGHLARSFVRV
jgi:hypothetical protein